MKESTKVTKHIDKCCEKSCENCTDLFERFVNCPRVYHCSFITNCRSNLNKHIIKCTKNISDDNNEFDAVANIRIPKKALRRLTIENVAKRFSIFEEMFGQSLKNIKNSYKKKTIDSNVVSCGSTLADVVKDACLPPSLAASSSHNDDFNKQDSNSMASPPIDASIPGECSDSSGFDLTTRMKGKIILYYLIFY